MRISDWSSDVCSSDLGRMLLSEVLPRHPNVPFSLLNKVLTKKEITELIDIVYRHCGQKDTVIFCDRIMALGFGYACKAGISRSEEHTSELQSLMRISYAVFCLKKKTQRTYIPHSQQR